MHMHMHMHLRYPPQRWIFHLVLEIHKPRAHVFQTSAPCQDDTLKRHNPRHLASRQATHVDGEVVQGRGPAQYANVHHAVSRAPVGVVAGDGHDVVTDACAATRTHAQARGSPHFTTTHALQHPRGRLALRMGTRVPHDANTLSAVPSTLLGFLLYAFHRTSKN
jgi:hypothetical protein